MKKLATSKVWTLLDATFKGVQRTYKKLGSVYKELNKFTTLTKRAYNELEKTCHTYIKPALSDADGWVQRLTMR
ncbi:hypothetical protein J4G08_06870 [Candidatus Poribacteria bacterium]|nr:hypothetical protein [Candidatus Poribacteria bacterium]